MTGLDGLDLRLSMWEPDGTYWLNDVLTLDDPQPWDAGDPRLHLQTDWVIGDDGSVRVAGREAGA